MLISHSKGRRRSGFYCRFTKNNSGKKAAGSLFYSFCVNGKENGSRDVKTSGAHNKTDIYRKEEEWQ